MIKIACLSLLFCTLSFWVRADAPASQKDSLVKILTVKDPDLRERQLLLYLRFYIPGLPSNQLANAKAETMYWLEHYHVAHQPAVGSFIDALCQLRLEHYNAAEKILVHTIAMAAEQDDHDLLYTCFTHLGFIQTYQGNIAEAVASFGLAKKEASLLEDPYMQVVIDINISDIYYRINLCSQALFYLRQAQGLMAEHHINIARTRDAILNNISECYFRMGNVDSVAKYNRLLHAAAAGTQGLYVYQRRTDYYLDLLRGDNKEAIRRMEQLRGDEYFGFGATDEQNLADAYFHAGQPDSARAIISRLLNDDGQRNHPEIRSHLYEVLGLIAERAKDEQQAADAFKTALGQANEQIDRLTRVDTIASRIKLDEVQSVYLQKAEKYRQERLWMGFTIIVTVLSLVIAGMAYRTIKRKKYYEQLLFTAKKQELAFINSHEVRRHLSNILGIVDTIKQSEDKHQTYMEAEDHLLSAAGDLDTAINNISAKLEG